MLHYVSKHMRKQVSAESEIAVHKQQTQWHQRTSRGRDFLVSSLHSRSAIESAVSCTSAAQLVNMEGKIIFAILELLPKIGEFLRCKETSTCGSLLHGPTLTLAAAPLAGHSCVQLLSCHVTNVPLLRKPHPIQIYLAQPN